MTMLEIIRGICQFPQRGPCTESETKASQFIFDVMTKEGLSPRFHDFEIRPKFYLAYAAHLLLAVIFGFLIFRFPMIGAIGLILIMISFYGDLTTRWYWLRNIIPAGKSRHVIGSFGPQDAKQTLIFSGHHDAGPTSFIFDPVSLKEQTRFFKRYFKSPMPQYWLLTGGMGFLVLATFLMHLQWLPIVLWSLGFTICMVSAGVHLSMWGAAVSPGASDNASGVAAAIEAARRLREFPIKDTRVVVISWGAEESMMAGSGTTASDVLAPFNKANTYIINFEGAGGGSIRYCLGEGTMNLFRYDKDLIHAAKKVAAKPGYEFFKPYKIRSGGTDALPCTLAGYKAITLLGLDDNDYPPHYHWHTDTPDNIDETSLLQAVDVALKMARSLK